MATQYYAIIDPSGIDSGTDQNCHYTSLKACIDDKCSKAEVTEDFAGPDLSDVAVYETDGALDMAASDSGNGVQITIYCRQTGATDDTNGNIQINTSKFVSTAECYIKILCETAYRHDGKWKSDAYIFDQGSGNGI
jgi:hypothetical protein